MARASAERRQFVAWVRTGALEGDPADAPPPRTFHDSKWEIGEPDLVTRPSRRIRFRRRESSTTVCGPAVCLHRGHVDFACRDSAFEHGLVHHCNMAHFTIGKDFDAGNFITGRVPGGTPLLPMKDLPQIPAQFGCGTADSLHDDGKARKEPDVGRVQISAMGSFTRTSHLQVTTSKSPFRREQCPPSFEPDAPRRRQRRRDVLAHALRGKDMTFIAHSPKGNPKRCFRSRTTATPGSRIIAGSRLRRSFSKGTRIESSPITTTRLQSLEPRPEGDVRSARKLYEMMFGFFFYTDDDQDLNLSVDPKRAARSSVP